MTTGDYLRQWLATRCAERRIAPRTKDCYEATIRLHIAPELGDVQLEALSAPLIAAMLEQLHARSARSAQLAFILLRAALADAEEAGEIQRSPCRHVAAPAYQPAPMEVWTDEQIGRYIAAAMEHRHAAAWLMAIQCGMRRGEIVGLRWTDIEHDARILHISNQRQRLDSGLIVDAPPKSRAGVRHVPYNELLASALQSAPRRSRYVVPLTPSGLDHAHRQLLGQLDLPYIRLHGLRHTMATAAIRHGASMRALQMVLGHSDVTTTSRIYTHPDMTMLRAVIDCATIAKVLR